ncbi:MAG: Flp pilus assembly complex ATPase component TadA [Planctomycetes bacterium]|nr:Flp pilus assembly complex ATPase component TadA [Planctomycetota bacterium]
MIFGFGRRADDADLDEEEEVEHVQFLGPLSGAEVNLGQNARLAEAGLLPAKELVTDALLRRADRIRIEPKGNVAAVSLFVDGKPYPGGRLSKQQGLAVTQMLKLLAGLNIKERTKRQSGGLKAELEEVPYELGVESSPLGEGAERLSVTIRNLKQKLDTPEALGFSDDMRAKIRTSAALKRGLILVCGPPYSGVTTTTYAVVRTVDAYIYNIYSIAGTGTRELSHITETEIKEGDDLPTTIQRIRRMEADALFLDPLRDAETVKTLFAEREKMCYISEFPAKDAAHGILQLMKWTGDPKLVVDGLSLIISQKLIRTLCKDCREAYRPNPKIVQKVGLPPETKVLYRPPQPDPEDQEYQPCTTCGETGYIGRAGLYELIELTDEMKQFLLSGSPTPQSIKQQARKLGMQSLQQEGLRLVAEGRTSLEELQRAFKPAS